jgi:hypothetical protein
MGAGAQPEAKISTTRRSVFIWIQFRYACLVSKASSIFLGPIRCQIKKSLSYATRVKVLLKVCKSWEDSEAYVKQARSEELGVFLMSIL